MRTTVPLKALRVDSHEVVLVRDFAYVTLVVMRENEDELWRDPLWLCPLVELQCLHHTSIIHCLRPVPQVAVLQPHSMMTTLDVSGCAQIRIEFAS